VVITFVDITERRQTEEALRTSERQLRHHKRLVEALRDPIFVWEFDGGIIEWNRGSEELYGYSRAEALGKRKEQLLGSGDGYERAKAKLVQNGSWVGELKHRTKDGRVLTVDARTQLESLDGQRLVMESVREVAGGK
jgi:two-component system, chemotaxis family, CheB/CheR fusion protein